VSSLPGGYTPPSDGVGRSGVQNFGAAHKAVPGAQGGRRRRRRGGERLMVPDAEFTSYYGRPVLKAAPWGPDIPAYLFLGGLAGGSALLGAGADLTDRPALRRSARFAAFGSITLSLGALVHDLGRPGRFLNMLRTAKPTSPMSIGTWILTAFGPLAGAAAASELADVLAPEARGPVRVVGRLAGLSAAAVAPAVASYTAVLISDTATPSWHEGYREMPFVFVGSAAAAAGGWAMVTVPVDQAGPARRMAVAGALTELASFQRMEQSMGIAAEPLHDGKGGEYIRASKALTTFGLAGALAGRRSRVAAVLSGAAFLAASACTRFGIFHAGQQSARDPKYTVVPQRERLDARTQTSGDHAGAAQQ
jgi:formate-dependent nitrite reductase membrane component NrfD